MLIMGIIIIVALVLNKIQAILIDEYKKELDKAWKSSDVVLEYCLQQILKQSIQEDVQDFETAHKCQSLLEHLKAKHP